MKEILGRWEPIDVARGYRRLLADIPGPGDYRVSFPGEDERFATLSVPEQDDVPRVCTIYDEDAACEAGDTYELIEERHVWEGRATPENPACLFFAPGEWATLSKGASVRCGDISNRRVRVTVEVLD